MFIKPKEPDYPLRHFVPLPHRGRIIMIGGEPETKKEKNNPKNSGYFNLFFYYWLSDTVKPTVSP